ncbi:excinuclease ABC subunit A [Candidatus Falkowbacteria bacterium RIFOXYA2_FULL_35_8]|uniref:UvrABC system protein A n=1 Tax=Candidatus Falkowbacteria bacterium RIFOXYC2_FULL_36_12 TaxID=1798002 RepID=A0A1F5SYV7_9BACT|nr:MAG: excinuclease ABC subunit A [Candidatus Falkowbacteria bacterium RIFOXYB2_FULL_35_7]OGF31915.1 MAG: excinuclease ABC subunit A [Candidatus Falkowbacteria bacterium RIFOXYC2_FULL_36_12]OGF34677.1 MAG: excinuclease ABC subunit A [Candidatus Falkowbacteria bacterium RIFOXYA2_FULL_35_8]
MSHNISIKGARVNNLKNIDVEIPRNKFVVITGLSGSGKSSLAFDTIYAEGQRRYVESLSSYARQFLEVKEKPDVDQITGLSPSIAIDQRSVVQNPRSTVGTITEVYDLIRLLYSRIGHPHCPDCGVEVHRQTVDEIVDKIWKINNKINVTILAPVVREEKGTHKKVVEEIRKANFYQIRFDGIVYNIEELESLDIDKNQKHTIEVVVDRVLLDGDKEMRIQLAESVKIATDLGDGQIVVHRSDNDEDVLFSQYYSCPKCGLNLPEIELRSFSFNSPFGACPECSGLGMKQEIDPELVINNSKLSLAEGAIKPWTKIFSNQKSMWQLLEKVASKHRFSIELPVSKLSKKILDLVLYGTGIEEYEIGVRKMTFQGVIPGLEEKHRETDSDYIRKEIEKYMRAHVCTLCQGKRLRKESLAVTVAGLSIAEYTDMSIKELKFVFDEFKSSVGQKFDKKKYKTIKETISKRDFTIVTQLVHEILRRLEFLTNVGLSYLSMSRSSVTLSGGEAQRLRLATQLGSALSEVIYVLDEPSIGLHAVDNEKLINTLKILRDKGNSVIVVEHDKETIAAADYIFDLGPGAGIYGGQLVAEGTPAEIIKNKNSLTGKYLSGQKQIGFIKKNQRGNGKKISIKGATANNLQNISVDIPLGQFVCITGVSGSGKSTLINDILAKALARQFYRSKDLPAEHKSISGIDNLDKVITIDQTPIGRTPRSNPATYTGVFTYIRDLFTQVPEAKIKGYDAGRFSFNVKGGRCEACGGDGYVKYEMQLLSDVYVECEECKGRRYNKETLEIHYRGKNIADVLAMTVSEANEFFRDTTIINEKLTTLEEVGLGYLTLGQPATTLSGGEAQRIKLATELSRYSTGKTLYILDEPTTGLHFDDINKLLLILNRLVEKGNTVLVIEHNMDVIKNADWVVDLGPGGGDEGGFVVAEGTPKDIIKNKKSLTAKYLIKELK